MSSFKTIAVGLALLALSGCGFQPIYADKGYRRSDPASGSAAISGDLARVRLLPVTESVGSTTLPAQTGRGGQKLQNLLIDRMYPDSYPKQPTHTLTIALTTYENRLGIQKDSSATRAELVMTAQLILKKAGVPATADAGQTPASLGEEVYRTTVRTRVSYNILDAQYGTLAARENAVDRALEQVANDTVTRLALFFSRDPAEVAPPIAPTPAASPAKKKAVRL